MTTLEAVALAAIIVPQVVVLGGSIICGCVNSKNSSTPSEETN